MLIFSLLFLLLIMGLPVGFAIGISCFLFLMFANGPVSPNIIMQKMFFGIDSFPLLALPFFILAGDLMAYGTTPRLMRLANAFLGTVRGGLAGVNVASSAFFGAISGSGVATVAAIGSVIQPEMVKKGYGKGFTASLTAGGGVLGMIIPPSMPMVVFGVTASVSIGGMFLGGIIPGLLTSLFLILFGIWVSRKRNYGDTGVSFSLKECAAAVRAAILPIMLPIIILGGVMSGVFTPTESAVVAVVYAFILAMFVYRELKWKDLIEVITRSSITSAIILFIISTAAPFGWILTMEKIPVMLSGFITGLTDSKVIIMILISILLLILGTFMETIAIIIIMTPILFPIATGIGLDPIHFGVIMMLNLAIGGVTPPLAVGLFTSAKIIGIRIEETFPDVLYVVGIMLLAYLLVLFVPQLTLFIPSLFA
ncbi:TRAP transporter large permease [Brevibacillus massiliensis]|uniref:TRAP transporter large permease n=1 Tax=Brevibacillus massiliensis TaxID=1118054 RepID=UPI0002D5BBC2|nr:TRAP transporter large permease [Brevibacillus massiliensis]